MPGAEQDIEQARLILEPGQGRQVVIVPDNNFSPRPDGAHLAVSNHQQPLFFDDLLDPPVTGDIQGVVSHIPRFNIDRYWQSERVQTG